MKTLPFSCPSCGAALHVKSLGCNECDTAVSGDFELPLLARLSQEEQQLIIDFVKSSGSLKIMAQQLGLSYPTVRNMLDALIQKLATDTPLTRKK
jgi:hypothetical protein